MPSYKFYQLDVFTSRPLSGNALAVFPEPAGLTPEQMQGLAQEMNLSETTFVFDSEAATRRVRFFTPTAEIPLAGHPTVGTWWLLAELGRLDLPRDGALKITQETGAGVLPVTIHTRGGSPERIVMVQAQPEFGARVEDTGRLARALGGAETLVESGPAPQVVSTGLPQLMVPCESLEALRALPSGGAGSELVGLLRDLGTDCAMLYSLETESPEATVHCRMFAPHFGIPEDPASGAAFGSLAAYLVKHRLVRAGRHLAMLGEQGLEMGRPSRLFVDADIENGRAVNIHVGGQCVLVGRGTIQLP